MRKATHALLTADRQVAEQVQGTGLEALPANCDRDAQALRTATDLRTVFYCAEKLERMNELAALVADTARYAHPAHAIPPELERIFTELGAVTAWMADRLAAAIRSSLIGGFAELRDTEHTVAALHTEVLTTITGEQWAHGRHRAVVLALTTRFYERFADHAVAVAKRLEFADTPENGR